MMRARIVEEGDIALCRFLGGLNLEIRDRVGLLPYKYMNDLV